MAAQLVDGEEPSLEEVYFEVTDMSTGEKVLSDYAIAQMISAVLSPTERYFNRYPVLLAEPRLVGQRWADRYRNLQQQQQPIDNTTSFVLRGTGANC